MLNIPKEFVLWKKNVFFENFNISINNVISVESTKALWYSNQVGCCDNLRNHIQCVPRILKIFCIDIRVARTQKRCSQARYVLEQQSPTSLLIVNLNLNLPLLCEQRFQTYLILVHPTSIFATPLFVVKIIIKICVHLGTIGVPQCDFEHLHPSVLSFLTTPIMTSLKLECPISI